MNIRNMIDPIEKERLKVMAPSVFAESHSARMSDKYQQYSTSTVVDLMQKESWLPVMVKQQNCHTEGRIGFQKHLLRFRHEREIEQIQNGMITEGFDIVLTNSHDGSSCYKIDAGVFRLVCINGAIVGSSIMSMKVRHMGSVPADVINASMNMVNEMPKIMASVERMKSITLSNDEQVDFVRKAYGLKWTREEEIDENLPIEEKPIVFNPNDLLRARREIDKGKSDLWTTFNIVQENMIKGRPNVITNKGIRKLRAINGIDEDLRINKALWDLSDEVVEVKSK